MKKRLAGGRAIVCLVLAGLLPVTLSGCVSGIDGFTTYLVNETDVDIVFDLVFIDSTNSTELFNRTLHIPADSRTDHITETIPENTKTMVLGRVHGGPTGEILLEPGHACGSCILHGHVTDTGVWFGMDVLD